MRRVESRLRVRYAETDQMGVVYYANYFVWMEIGRVDYCSAIGFEYRDMESDGVVLAVTDAHCRYRASAHFHDDVRLLTWMEESRSRTIRFGYEMHRVEGDQLLATGDTLHMACDPRGKPVRLPEKYRRYFPLTVPVDG